MRKVLTILGTRPELIKMSLVIQKLDHFCNHVLVHTGQNYDYELNQIFFDDLGIRKPDYFLQVAEEGRSPADTIGRIIASSDKVFEIEAPDAVLIYGDTNSGLAVISAKRRKIPVFHMEAGNRCFDQRVPEELNRKVIDHLSDVNMVLTEQARQYLLREGLPGDRIFKVGSHLREVLDVYGEKIRASQILDRMGLKADEFLVVSAHREENVDSPGKLRRLLASLNALAAEYEMTIVFSVHPRTRQRLAKLEDDVENLSTRVQMLPPFAFTDYIHLQTRAYCVLSDSGTITEEASLLGFPAVTMRDAHERPEGIDAGTLVVSAINPVRILDAVKVARNSMSPQRRAGRVLDYEAPAVSSKVVRMVISYIDIINRTVWSKTDVYD